MSALKRAQVCRLRKRRLAGCPGGPRRQIADDPGLAGADADGFRQVATKILPSPILPVLAALMIASMTSWRGRPDRHLDLQLGQEVHDVFGPAILLLMALLAAEALRLRHGHTLHADLVRASFTSSSLNGLMTASIFFMPWLLILA